MAVSFVASTDATFVTATSIGQNTPAGIQDDDGLFAFVMSRDVVTPPAGWTELENQSCTDGGTTQYLIVYQKDTVTSGDSSTLFTFNNASSTRMGLCYMVARATSLLVAEVTSGSITIIDFIINQAAATATRSNELFFYAGTTISQGSGEVGVFAPVGSTLASGISATDYRLATAYVSRDVGQSVSGSWNFQPGGSTAFYNGMATVTLRLVDTVVEDVIDDDIVHYAYALHGNQSTELVAETVDFWAANNAKPFSNAAHWQNRFLGADTTYRRANSSEAAGQLTVKYFGFNDSRDLWLLVVSSRYLVDTPAGFTNRVNIAASGSNGQRYLKVMEMTDKSLWTYNDDVTVTQGIEAPICMVLCKFTGGDDGYPVFQSGSTSIVNSGTTDIATPPALSVLKERETVITIMVSDPHPSAGTGHSTNANVGFVSPDTPGGQSDAPISANYNIVVGNNVYYRRGETTSGTLGYASTPTYTSDVAVLSATLRYYIEQPMIMEFWPRLYMSFNGPLGNNNTKLSYTNTRTETVGTTDVIRPNWHQVVAEAPALTGESAFTLAKPVTATAVALFLEAVSPLVTYVPTLTETPQLADPTRAAWPKTITESTTLTPAASVAQAARVLEALGLLEALLPVLTYGKTVSETILARDLLARFASGEVIEALNASVSLSASSRLTPVLSDALGLEALATRTLVLRVVSTNQLNLADTRSLQLLLNPTISENVEITLGYVAPGDSFTTWTVNARTGAVSEYLNYGFNSFAGIGQHYLGASSSGLYELAGDTDAGTNIIGTLKTGYQSFGDGRPVMFKAVYLGVRGGGGYYFKVDMGDGRESVYQIVAEDMKTSKINLGKGLRARYFAFELISVGQDFDLESVEFVPVLSQRHR